MIDFKNSSFVKLKEISKEDGEKAVSMMLLDNENVFAAFKAIRDMVIFTDKRIISINVQGVTGAKKDYTSLPYSKVQVFSVETSGTLDMDAELELWFSGCGKVKFEFKSTFDIAGFNKILSGYIL